jgi:hypothetical protein
MKLWVYFSFIDRAIFLFFLFILYTEVPLRTQSFTQLAKPQRIKKDDVKTNLLMNMHGE